MPRARAGLATACLVVLAACSPSPDDPAPTPEPTAAETTTETTASPTPPRDLDLGRGLQTVPGVASAWLRQHPDAEGADLVRRRIARQPSGFWLVGTTADLQLRDHAALARRNDRTLTLVLYNHPGRDDGVGGSPGAGDLAAYRGWVDRVSDVLGDTRAVVVVEPDALWFHDRLPDDAARETRVEALRYAVDTLTRDNPRALLYVEAGTSSGSVEPGRMAELLREVGVSDRVGFAVNVSSYAPEPAITRWAEAIRADLRDEGVDDARYVVDTGRNGNPGWDAPYEWCNTPDRRLGVPPGVPDDRTTGRDLDLWVKAPATSDGGECRGTLGLRSGIREAYGTDGGEFLPREALRMAQDGYPTS